MGGYNSTRWNHHSRKTTVEECVMIDALRVLPSARNIETHAALGDLITWTSNGRTWAAVAYLMEYDPAPIMCLSYGIASGERVTERVRLTATRPFNNAVRYWFTCPSCARRCRCLHKPSYARRFLCRKCHDLGYNSQQDDGITRRADALIPGLALYEKALKVKARMDKYKYWCKGKERLWNEYRAIVETLGERK